MGDTNRMGSFCLCLSVSVSPCLVSVSVSCRSLCVSVSPSPPPSYLAVLGQPMHDEATPEALPHQEDGALPLGGLGDGRVQAVEVGGQRFLGGRDPPHARVFAVLAALHQDHATEDRQLPLLEEGWGASSEGAREARSLCILRVREQRQRTRAQETIPRVLHPEEASHRRQGQSRTWARALRPWLSWRNRQALSGSASWGVRERKKYANQFRLSRKPILQS